MKHVVCNAIIVGMVNRRDYNGQQKDALSPIFMTIVGHANQFGAYWSKVVFFNQNQRFITRTSVPQMPTNLAIIVLMTEPITLFLVHADILL